MLQDAGEHELGAAAKAGGGVRNDTAQADPQVGVGIVLVDGDLGASRGGSYVGQVLERVVVHVFVAGNHLRAHFADVLRPRHWPVSGKAAENDRPFGRNAASVYFLQHVGNEVRRRRRAGEVVHDQHGGPSAARQLTQRRRADGLAQGGADLARRQWRTVVDRGAMDFPLGRQVERD